MNNELEQTFFQRRYTNSPKKESHRKRCSLVIKEIQIKTRMRYHYTPSRMAMIHFKKGNNYDKDVEKLYIAVGM